jgi:hypothetical protein
MAVTKPPMRHVQSYSAKQSWMDAWACPAAIGTVIVHLHGLQLVTCVITASSDPSCHAHSICKLKFDEGILQGMADPAATLHPAKCRLVKVTVPHK